MHLWGNPAPMDRFVDIARRHGVALIEDCSHAHGARYRDRPVGSWGDIGCFSLQGPKAVSGGEAGIAVTNDPVLFDHMLVLGHYGLERWQDGALTAPAPPPGVAAARERLPQLLADAGAPEGVRIEDKGSALAVHTRRAADPAGALAALREPLAGLAADVGLVVEPGRLVIELRPPGMDKGAALTALVAERKAGPVLFAGDDLGDLAAFGAVRALRGDGHPGVTVCSASGEVSELAAEADLVVDGPGGVAALLGSLARSLTPPPRPAP